MHRKGPLKQFRQPTRCREVEAGARTYAWWRACRCERWGRAAPVRRRRQNSAKTRNGSSWHSRHPRPRGVASRSNSSIAATMRMVQRSRVALPPQQSERMRNGDAFSSDYRSKQRNWPRSRETARKHGMARARDTPQAGALGEIAADMSFHRLDVTDRPQILAGLPHSSLDFRCIAVEKVKRGMLRGRSVAGDAPIPDDKNRSAIRPFV